MINYLPFVAALLSMFIIQKEWVNRIAAGWFGIFYGLSMAISYTFYGEPEYFMWSIILSLGFIVTLSLLRKITTMILVLCLCDIILASIDAVSFLTYNMGLDSLYQLRWSPEKIVITLQLTALGVRNGRHINISSVYGNMVMYTRNVVRNWHYHNQV